ncbi:MAG: tetratricopeptide repeat protein [Prosthecochloris sp.]|uniref:DUF3856 domain-containing protein n=1 Tax=Prosthecochloris sp. TaxID=290513 RepID=UPI002587E560|nr:DUF3856 domain-containing protein [Prosthecochloris sp.]MCW8797733.1 tetratricopeptide repeat protein [Prosthecochloris sp.]
MKPLKEVAMSYMALSEAQKKLEEGAYGEAAAESSKAMDFSKTMPPGETFDHDGFDALCYAVLASARAGLGEYDACLEAAGRALHYFNRRGELQQDEGKQWIAVVFSRGVAFHETGVYDEALKNLNMAGEMITERKGELPGKETMLKEIERRKTMLLEEEKSQRKPGYKAWWEFWS